MKRLSPEEQHALKMAVKNELDTIHIYQSMLKQVNNSDTRKMLNKLIEEEHDHEDRMKEKLNQLGIELEPVNIENPELPNRDQILDIELDNFTVTELIGVAIENEKISRDFYQEQYKRLENNEVKEIFRWLVDQENNHIKNLQNERDAHTQYEEVRFPKDDD